MSVIVYFCAKQVKTSMRQLVDQRDMQSIPHYFVSRPSAHTAVCWCIGTQTQDLSSLIGERVPSFWTPPHSYIYMLSRTWDRSNEAHPSSPFHLLHPNSQPQQTNLWNWVKVALNLDIEGLRWSRWKDEVRMRPHSSYPWPGRANRQMSMGPESGNPSILEDSDTVHFVQDLGFVSQCINTQQCEQRDDTTRVVGDRLHIPTFHQLPFWRTFNMYRDNLKHTQTWPLKEDFRQLPGQVTGKVFQTTWR